ncbi:unnamed protein product [Arabidopsis arenosa]|uniref:Uncharacterized protein n=1 Tax=Arabidopsis arenosa TaxID=38785 RepID=A0A8S2AAU8_ARAAE|nr:unnamed protein product [Arabidopsis arenosa]
MVLLYFGGKVSKDALIPITIPQISEDAYKYLEDLPKDVRRILVPILRSRPDPSDVVAFMTETTASALWKQKEQKRINRHCPPDFQHLRYDLNNNTGWAIIAAKLLSIAHFLRENVPPFVNCSAQYLLDCVPGKKVVSKDVGSSKRRRICDNISTIAEAIEYALNNKIPREDDWEYLGYQRDDDPPVDISYFNVMGKLQSLTLQEALSFLNKQPVAAKLHLFNSYQHVDRVYRGPIPEYSDYIGLEDVMVYEVTIYLREWVAIVKLPCRIQGFLRVSLDAMLVYVLRDNLDQADARRIVLPSRLLTEFNVIVG